MLDLLLLLALALFLAGFVADLVALDREHQRAEAREARRHNRALRAILNLSKD